MLYFVETKEGVITGKGSGAAKNEEQIEVSADIYEQLTTLPANFEQDEQGNIISVTPIPKLPEPPPEPTLDDYLLDLDFRISSIELGL